uniref:Mobilization protein n=1 Tax=Levilactobacillus zymae TaxID=267363 RepID=A0A7G8AFL1_9LACO|nr:MobV family relaxase [Levilactobacillus zymae]QNI18402.1 Putative protein ORF2 [Levilactobacillus zymae]
MSFVVARMQKLKADNLVGLGNHDQRKTSNHSNQDIDVSRSHLNYDLVAGRTQNFKTDIQNYIDNRKASQRAVRKDAVLANEWVITSDKGFFEQLDERQTRAYFETAKQYFADNFGDENIRYAIVHLDESTPHMHMGIVPFDNENKLSAKRVFNREALQKVQDELPEFLQAKGFKIERGQKDTKRKNLTVPEYKAMQDNLAENKQELETVKADTKKQRQEFEAFKKSDFDVTNVETLQPRFKKGYVLVKKDDFEQMKQGAIYAKSAFIDSLHAKSDAERAHDSEVKASSRALELEMKNDKLQAENNKLRTQLNHAQDLIKRMFKVLKEKLGDKVHMKPETWHKIGLKAPNEPDKQSKKRPERNTGLSR